MITTKQELRECLRNEQPFYDTSLKARLLKHESWYKGSYFKHLRYAEYYTNKPSCGLFDEIRRAWHCYRMRHIGYVIGFQIPLNTMMGGVKVYHFGPIIVNTSARIGRDCTIYPGVTVGGAATGVPTIGDNVFLGLGSKVFGGVTIGNNVTIAPNAVVVKNVPDNAVVGGVPAKIIKIKES